MVNNNQSTCPKCGGQLKYYDSVKRIVRTKRRITRKVIIRRMKCDQCGSLHRELPVFLLPYKQYETDVIIGVIEGIITSDTFGFEDYPCEMTMLRWRNSHDLQSLL
ncbi:MAG: DUF6431 domain-containing protein [bacterium]|nr:DUF6431 domain-containing protein [bacterium]